jgi:DUF1365 family protein
MAMSALSQSRPLASAVYSGWIRHRRYRPQAHSFRYRLYLFYLDLSELDQVFSGRRFWSIDRRNLGEFRRSDYLGDPSLALDEAVRRRAAEALGRRPEGPIRLLAHLRTFGHCFNPVAFYYCYRPDGETLDCIVAEITNTPWKERHSYVLAAETAERHGSALAWGFPKAFHVSPFLPMQRDYAWRFQPPGAELRVHMDVNDGAQKDFDATLVLERRPLDGATLVRSLVRYPLMTLKVVVAIHWQAFLIWRARNPVYDHPGKHPPPKATRGSE